MEANVSVCRVTKRLRHRGENLKAEGAPQANRRCIGLDNRIEQHRPIAICTCLLEDAAAQGAARALTAPRGMDNKTGVGNVGTRAGMEGMSVCAPDYTSSLIYSDDGAPW